MSALRCSTCAINFPTGYRDDEKQMKCGRCGSPIDYIQNDEPHEDWKERVQDVAVGVAEDKVVTWRFATLLRADFEPRQAEELAMKPHHELDLHRAVELAKKAGPALAYEILS